MSRIAGLGGLILLLAMSAHAADCQPVAEQVIASLNALRASAPSCGGAAQAPALALQWDERLARSARLFAEELSQRDMLSHEGQTSRTLRERLRAVGYPFRRAAENLAAGADSLDEVLDQWLHSTEHCENLMQPNFRDFGLACVAAASASGRYDHFWVLHLGTSTALRSTPDRSP